MKYYNGTLSYFSWFFPLSFIHLAGFTQKTSPLTTHWTANLTQEHPTTTLIIYDRPGAALAPLPSRRDRYRYRNRRPITAIPGHRLRLVATVPGDIWWSGSIWRYIRVTAGASSRRDWSRWMWVWYGFLDVPCGYYAGQPQNKKSRVQIVRKVKTMGCVCAKLHSKLSFTLWIQFDLAISLHLKLNFVQHLFAEYCRDFE